MKKTIPPPPDDPGMVFYDPDNNVVPHPAVKEQQQANGKDDEPLPLAAYELPPTDQIPVRQWLHAGHYIRKHVVMTVAPGAYGKTSLVTCNAIEMATGRGLIGPTPRAQLRVLYWNGEDPREEIDRRIAAICQHYEVSAADFHGWLFVGDKIKPGQRFAFINERQQLVIRHDVLHKFEQFVADHGIDQAILDPLVAFHRVPENNTSAMEELVSAFGSIADRQNCCIEFSHHTRKAQGNFEITVDDSRGAGAIANATRSVRVFNRMTAEEAKLPNISAEDRRLYLRVSRDKPNMMPPGKATWIRLASVQLLNGPGGAPGDNVQVIEQWDYPQPFDDVTADDMRWMREQVRQSDWLKSAQSGEKWIGALLAQKLSLDVGNDGHRTKINAVLKKWFDTGVLATAQRKNENRKMREYVVPGPFEESDDAAPVDFDH